MAAEGAVARGIDAADRRRGHRAGDHRPAARLQEADAVVPEEPPRPGADSSPTWSPDAKTARSCTTCWPFPRSTGSNGCCGTCSTRTSSCPRSASARCPSSTRTTRSPCGWAASSIGSSTGPASRKASLFGGNSNWRGPIWFPINYLLIEALQRYDHYYGPSLQVEFPTGSGNHKTLGHVALELAKRLTHLFLPDEAGKAPPRQGSGGADFGLRIADRGLKKGTSGANPKSEIRNPQSQEPVLFHEYFHAETGQGLAPATKPAGPP